MSTRFIKLTTVQSVPVWIDCAEIVAVQHVQTPSMVLGQAPEFATMVATRSGTHGVRERAEDVIKAIGVKVVRCAPPPPIPEPVAPSNLVLPGQFGKEH